MNDKEPGKENEILSLMVRREGCYYLCFSEAENEVLRDLSEVIWAQNQNQHSAAHALNSLCQPVQGSTGQPDQLSAHPFVHPAASGYGDHWAIISPLASRALSN